jgi:threonine aldolase
MPEPTLAALRARGWQFYTFIGGGARFMFAWDSQPARVEELAADLRALCTATIDSIDAAIATTT